ncbi:hypothetical protein Mapa_003574 [Marchantia paleacea]|nr:hypothetical protein Mapa_003574 [Marchantia paleacea]
MYQRESIVNRRKIPPSRKNDENVDREYDMQMCGLRKRQEQFKDIEQLVRTSVSPTKEEVLDSQHKWKGIMEIQLRQKEEQHEIQSEAEHKLHCFNEYVQRCVGPHSKEEEESREQARRDYLRQIMEENMKVAAEKLEWQKKQRQKDIAQDNYRLTTPCSWNRRHYV